MFERRLGSGAVRRLRRRADQQRCSRRVRAFERRRGRVGLDVVGGGLVVSRPGQNLGHVVGARRGAGQAGRGNEAKGCVYMEKRGCGRRLQLTRQRHSERESRRWASVEVVLESCKSRKEVGRPLERVCRP